MKFSTAVLIGATSSAAAAAAASQPLAPLAFEPLPLGQIKPNGWLRDVLVLQANGLGGHLNQFWKYVSNSSWIGKGSEYSILHEAWPYWLNAIVPLAYGVDDERLKGEIRSAVDYVLDHQQSDGWIGYEVGTERNMWPRNLVLLGLMQLAQADSDYTDRIVTAMQKFQVIVNTMLADNYTGFWYHEGDIFDETATQWGITRAHDLMIPLMWLYEFHPGNLSQTILENLNYLYKGGQNWDFWYQADVFPRGDLNSLNQSFYGNYWFYEHGVNIGEGLKATSVYRRFLHNDSLVQLTNQGVNWTFQYHGSASGSILADEYENGLQPYMGSETCTAVEVMYSLSYIQQALGDNYYGDRAELTSYNALPAAIAPDWWSRQYMAVPYQPYSKNLSETPFSDVNTVGQMFTLEGNYPCCTVNHPQGFPKFLSASFVKATDSGIAHALLAPASVSTTLKNSTAVSITSKTNYPFDLNLVYEINTNAPFDFYVRVPGWANAAESTITKTGSTPMAVKPDAQTGMHKILITAAGNSTLSYKLSTDIRLEARPNSTVAVHYGPLLYALYIESTNSSQPPRDFRSQVPLPAGYAPPEAQDWTILNTTAWNYAIDTSTLQYHYDGEAAPDKQIPNPIWAPGAPPNWISVDACQIEWPLYVHSVPGPAALPGVRNCLGDVETVKLVPYGSAKLHMVDLPTVDLSGKLDGKKQ